MNVTNFIDWNTAEPVEMVPKLFRRVLAMTEKMMICEFRAEPGAVVPAHSHPHEQVGYVVSGEMEITIDGTTRTCKAGDSYAIPGDVEHQAVFHGEAIIIDCFSPPREDYL